MSRKTRLNFIVDIVAFIAFVLLTATGALVHYVLPAGSGQFSTLWGMDRHQWGDLHFWLAVVLLVSMAVHLFLHWRWFVNMVRGRPREGSGLRVSLAVVGLLALLGLAVVPFLSPVRQNVTAPRHQQYTRPDTVHSSTETGSEIDPDAQRSAASFDIRGSMTIRDVERRTGVSSAVILSELGLPADVALNERLGQLRRQYGFEIQTIREIVTRHSQQ